MANLLAFTNFKRAEREYLYANGWYEEGKHWIAPETILGGWAGQRMDQNTAIKFQKDIDDYSAYRGELV